MSYWSHIMGSIEVSVYESPQLYKEYILKSVLSHMPDLKPRYRNKQAKNFHCSRKYWDSEGHVDIFINQSSSRNSSCTHDDSFVCANNPGYNIVNMNRFTPGADKNHCFNVIEENDKFIITFYGNFRHSCQEDLLRGFNHWMVRFAKSIWVDNIAILISGDTEEYLGEYDSKTIFLKDAECYSKLYQGVNKNYLKQ